MTILFEAEIREAITRCIPTKIAVAYIGIDWEIFIPDPNQITQIIVSPNIGTNPRAIRRLVNIIGWDRLFFLDELHAKMFIGDNSAVIGSANLTNNGLSGINLIELCYELNSNEELIRIDNIFANLLDRARTQYPTNETKQEQVLRLEQIWANAVANRIISNQHHHAQNFLDFQPYGNDDFYVVWYRPAKIQYSEEVNTIKRCIENDFTFHEEDAVESNQWVLVWRLTNNNRPHMGVRPAWFYIHEVFKNGLKYPNDKDNNYTTLAIQRNDREVPPVRFDINDDIVNAFRQAVQEENIAEYLIQNDRDIFSLEYSLQGMPVLIRRMHEILQE